MAGRYFRRRDECWVPFDELPDDDQVFYMDRPGVHHPMQVDGLPSAIIARRRATIIVYCNNRESAIDIEARIRSMVREVGFREGR